MKAFCLLACSALLTAGLTAPAFAAGGDASGNAGSTASAPSAAATPQSGSATGQNATTAQSSAPVGPQIVQKMRNDLTKAGFTDIHIMPSSFLVRAKDSSGNPVMMVVNPDSVTAITEENAASNSNRNAAPSAGTATPSPGTSQTKP